MSEWKEGAAKRRDVRNTKGPDATPTMPAKKDKKRWCGGHVGREHQPVCMPVLKYRFTEGWRELVCTVCGKVLDHYYSFAWSKKHKPPPPWVTS